MSDGIKRIFNERIQFRPGAVVFFRDDGGGDDDDDDGGGDGGDDGDDDGDGGDGDGDGDGGDGGTEKGSKEGEGFLLYFSKSLGFRSAGLGVFLDDGLPPRSVLYFFVRYFRTLRPFCVRRLTIAYILYADIKI